MQKLGQHFLKNKSALRLIVEALELKDGDKITEIGPGHGELTDEITKETSAKNLRVALTAIEKDAKLYEALRKKFASVASAEEVEQAASAKSNPSLNPNLTLTLINGDALELLKTSQADDRAAANILTGNIPYYITGHLLRTISELPAEQKPERCVFTIQKEVAERIIAKPPRMNRLAASVQFWAQPKILATLPAHDFSPPPKVDSAVIQLVTITGRRPPITNDQYYAAVRTIFAQPRKTIVNNLSVKAKNKKKIMETTESLGIDPNARPQDLTIEKIIAIAAAL